MAPRFIAARLLLDLGFAGELWYKVIRNPVANLPQNRQLTLRWLLALWFLFHIRACRTERVESQRFFSISNGSPCGTALDVSGRESNPHPLVFTSCSDAVELPSSITKAQRPIRKGTTDKKRVGSSTSCPAAQDLNLLAVRAPLLPITQTQRPVGKTRATRKRRWRRDSS